MKTKILLVAVSSFIIHHSSFGQGALTPPGAPALTMKTLAQIEPRTPISSVPFTISSSGSYYLTTNLTVSSGNAITIATNGVTLDLAGFTIIGTAPSATGYAIFLNSGLSDLTIFNGHIRGGVTNNGSGVYSGSGFAYGIYAPFNNPVNTRVSGVSVSGCLIAGINLGYGDSTAVEACTVRTVGSFGISATTVKGCAVADSGNYAIQGNQVSDCLGASVGGAIGIVATTAQNCVGSSGSGGTGINAITAQNCSGSSTGSGTGLNATIALNCFGSTTTGTGLNAFIANSCHGVSGSGTPLTTTHNVNSF